jgi:ABC-type multidrug transport system ATPase subunit
MNDKLITFKNLHVEIYGNEIIKNISLEIEKSNNIIVIAGASGCGKTTLLNIINNYNLPKHYKLTGFLNYHNSKIKMIGHKPIFNPFLTVKETIQIFISSYGLSNDVIFYLKKFNLEDICDKIIGNDENKSLSTGQLVQLSILINTLNIPDLLILDEPLSNLDIKTSLNIIKLLKNLNIPIIITLHHPNNLILEYVDYLYILEKGEIIVNTSLLEIGNKLEYYEQKLLCVDNVIMDKELSNINNKQVGIEIINYINYTANVSFDKKVYYTAYYLLTYFLRNKKYLIAIFASYIPTVITYLLLSGTDFSNKINGYVILINLYFMYITNFTGTTIISYFEIEKLIPITKHYVKINIINESVFYLFFVIYNFIITSIYTVFICSVDAYLNKNNNDLLSDFIKLASYAKFIEIYGFISVMYLMQDINITMSILITYTIFQVLNSGIMSNLYPEVKFFSMYYYFLNLISVKAQDLYDYPPLSNGEYIYTMYGYKTDTTNYYYYLIGFLIIPTLFFMYPIKNRFFLT